MITWLGPDTPFPPVDMALAPPHEAAGLLAAGADLTPERLIDAYRHGIFPWYSEGQPILWWSTDPRMVLAVSDFKVSHSLLKILRKMYRRGAAHDPAHWQVRFDSCFERVMRHCAQPRRDGGGTWITDDIVDAYCRLHQLGLAHCVESWYDGQLVGGAYGVAIGGAFFGESMFALRNDASKIALAHLVCFLEAKGVRMIDCQQETRHLASMGARPIPRKDFTAFLVQATAAPQVTDWIPPTPDQMLTWLEDHKGRAHQS